MMKKKDVILICSILIVALSLLLIISLFQDEGEWAIVKIDGVEVARYPLDRDGRYTLGGGTNVLVIEDGEAYVVEASCPDHLCINQGKISKNGQTITCLPNKLTILIHGTAKNTVDLEN